MLKPHSNHRIVFIATIPKIHKPYSAANRRKVVKENFATGNPIVYPTEPVCVYK